MGLGLHRIPEKDQHVYFAFGNTGAGLEVTAQSISSFFLRSYATSAMRLRAVSWRVGA